MQKEKVPTSPKSPSNRVPVIYIGRIVKTLLRPKVKNSVADHLTVSPITLIFLAFLRISKDGFIVSPSSLFKNF